MEFRLIYEGPLHGQGAKSSHKWEIRRALHPQLQRLWQERPLKDAAARLLAHPAAPGQVSVIVEKGGLLFAPLVTQRLDLYAELSVLLFRQQPRGPPWRRAARAGRRAGFSGGCRYRHRQ